MTCRRLLRRVLFSVKKKKVGVWVYFAASRRNARLLLGRRSKNKNNFLSEYFHLSKALSTTKMADKHAAEEQKKLDQLTINTIRTLAMDAVQAANSGHPGTPMAMAPVAFTIWQKFLRYDPEHPIWPNRDRFVLSIGHASMLIYSLLHLAQVKAVNPQYEVLGQLSVPLEDIKRFRQIDSRCPGHPEYRWTSGIETTTGPLGQGLANSVGMAISSKWLATRYNKPGFDMFNFNVYALCGDGCMMEGVSSEAASLAAHLKLNNLCWLYDNNRITIEGHTDLAFSEDVATRFVGYGWNVTRVADANDTEFLERALKTFQATTDRPTLIIVDSHIGYGAPNKQDSHAAHGEPLGEAEIKAAKKFYGWPEDAKFLVPPEVPQHFANGLGKRGASAVESWNKLFEEYKKQYPELAAEMVAIQKRKLPEGWDKDLPEFPAGKAIASRVSSGTVLNAFAKNIPWLIGGSADLAPSTKTRLTFEGAGDFSAKNFAGRNFHFGVREHAMASVMNGMALCKVRPFGSGFLIFSDYAKAGIRLAAIMEIPVIHVFTHDSIDVGEDGPTHQPVEQLLSLRSIPNLVTLRPCDANEVVEAWKVMLQHHHEPSVIVLTRQDLPTLDRTKYAPASGLAKGGYVLIDCEDHQPEVILIGTGSEVHLCTDAFDLLKAKGIKARVVSLPSWELYEKQSQEYKDSVLPPNVTARVSVEKGSTLGWERFVGLKGVSIGMSSFGASAPLKELHKKFGFNPERVAEAAAKLLGK